MWLRQWHLTVIKDYSKYGFLWKLKTVASEVTLSACFVRFPVGVIHSLRFSRWGGGGTVAQWVHRWLTALGFALSVWILQVLGFCGICRFSPCVLVSFGFSSFLWQPKNVQLSSFIIYHRVWLCEYVPCEAQPPFTGFTPVFSLCWLGRVPGHPD